MRRSRDNRFADRSPAMSRWVTAAKIISTLVFLALTNTHANLAYRIDQLIHNFDGYTGVLAFGGLWIFCIAGLLATAFLPRTSLRVLFSLPILAGTLVGFTYERIAGVEIDYDILTIMLEAVANIGDALAFYAAQIMLALAVCLVGFIALVTPPGLLAKRSRDRAPGWLTRLPGTAQYAVAAAPFVLIFALVVVRSGYGTAGLPVQYKVASLFLMIEASERLAPQLERSPVDLALDPEREAPAHVVLIVDESVRGDYLDINYPRGTTPRLLAHRDSIINFGHAVSASNCSAATNLIIRTGARLEALHETLGTNPYIWSYARRAGFRTAYVEAQVREGQLNNRMSLHEQSLIDEVLYAEGDGRLERDLAALDILNQRLERDTPHFVYLVKSGIHFPFEGSYPASEARFKPHMGQGHGVQDKELLENSYKNAISWSTDGFFAQLFETTDLENAVVLYTADHGQNLLDNGRRLTHCSTANTSPYEALVPMLVATRREVWQREFEQAAQRNTNRASHYNLFPTLLVLFGYDREPVKLSYGTSLLDTVAKPYGFVSGVVSEYRISLGARGRLRVDEIPLEILEAQPSAEQPR